MTKKITIKDLESQHDFCHTYKKGKRFKLKELYQGCPDDWFDKNVFEKTAIGIKSVKQVKSLLVKKFTFIEVHLLWTPFMIIKNKFSKWDKENNVVTLALGSFSDDKWNPGDIWMSTLKTDSEEPFEGTRLEWVTLREAVFDSVLKGKMFRSIFKKVESGAKVVEFNLPKENIMYRYHSKVMFLVKQEIFLILLMFIYIFQQALCNVGRQPQHLLGKVK